MKISSPQVIILGSIAAMLISGGAYFATRSTRPQAPPPRALLGSSVVLKDIAHAAEGRSPPPVVTMEPDDRSIAGEPKPTAVIHGQRHQGDYLLHGGAEAIHRAGEIAARLIEGTLTPDDFAYVESTLSNAPTNLSASEEDGEERHRAFFKRFELYKALGVPLSEIRSPLSPEIQAQFDAVFYDLTLIVPAEERDRIISIAVSHKVHERVPAILDRYEILAQDETSIRTARYARGALDKIRSGTSARENIDP